MAGWRTANSDVRVSTAASATTVKSRGLRSVAMLINEQAGEIINSTIETKSNQVIRTFRKWDRLKHFALICAILPDSLWGLGRLGMTLKTRVRLYTMYKTIEDSLFRIALKVELKKIVKET
ncbi:hypothetical protein Plhal304r1_c046g0127021 [Plasmopara halstedii]